MKRRHIARPDNRKPSGRGPDAIPFAREELEGVAHSVDIAVSALRGDFGEPEFLYRLLATARLAVDKPAPLDPYEDWALPRIAETMHMDTHTLVRWAVRDFVARYPHLAGGAQATLADFVKRNKGPAFAMLAPKDGGENG